MCAQKIGFLGCGQMAQALAKSIVKAGKATAGNVVLSDPYEPARKAMASQGFQTTAVNSEVLRSCDVIFVAVKPQVLASTVKSLPLDGSNFATKLFVSIVAGVTIEQLMGLFGVSEKSMRIVRVMPNVCCLVASSASAYCGSSACSQQDLDYVAELLGAAGMASNVEEKLMDAVTCVSGSGPAYIFTLIEAMADGGVKHGLSRDVARQLAVQTVLGSAKMVQETGSHPAQLRDTVCSPGGSTIAGVAALEEHGFRNAIIKCMAAVHDRSAELGKLV